VNEFVRHVLKFFETDWEASTLEREFEALAKMIADTTQGPETTIALRKLLEARDAALRAEVKP
jgi:hypothetical protein